MDIDDAADEDAAAAIADGKSDAVGFPFGLFRALPVVPVDDAMLMIAFDLNSGLAQGESGSFELARYDRAADRTTQSNIGTFKLYRYDGRARIRLTDADGGVILRADWDIGSTTGQLDIDGTTFAPIYGGNDAVETCIAYDIANPTPMLSIDEAPLVGVDEVGGATTMYAGNNVYDASEYTVTRKTVNGYARTVATNANETITMEVPELPPRRGNLVRQGAGRDFPVTVARIVCQP